MTTDEIKDQLLKTPLSSEIKDEDYLSTGSTLLNLALSGRVDGGFVRGHYFFYAGDSSTGKTFLSLTMLAEACKNPNFDKHKLIYDDVEGGALMDVEEYFGKKMAARIEPTSSDTVERFYYKLDDLLSKGKSFVYVLDSQDALDSSYAKKKFQEGKRAAKTGTQAKGDYGDGKAKIHSGRLRSVCGGLKKSGSILLIIGQTRDNVDGGMFAPPTIYSGGRALRFYCSAQIWSSLKGKLKRAVNTKEREIGISVKMAVKKNRLTGKEWTIELPIYFSYGVDDIGSMVDFLVNEKFWSEKDKIITASDFVGLQGNREALIKQIEERSLESDLRDVVVDSWKEIEALCVVERKKRYE